MVDWFLSTTGGVPGAMESLFETWARPAGQGGVPEVAPIDGHPATASILAALAVMGRPLSLNALRRIIQERLQRVAPRGEDGATGLPGHGGTDGDERALAEALTALFGARRLSKTVEAGELRISFARPADQMATYEALPADERRALHAAAALLLAEDAYDRSTATVADATKPAGSDGAGARGAPRLERDDAPLEEIARHALDGALGEQAVDWAVRAGERLTACFSYDRAGQLYERALALTQREHIRATLEERLLELAELAGDYPKALELGERLIARGRVDALLLRRMGRLDLLHADFVAAERRLAEARALAQAAGERVVEGLCLADIAETHYRAGDSARALGSAEEGLRLFAGDSSLAGPRLSMANVIAKVLIDRGDYRAAIAQLADNRETAYAAGLQSEAARAEINLGIAHLRLGDYDEANARYRAALQVCQALGDHRNLAIAQQNIAVLAHWRRDYATALVEFQRSVATFKRLGNREWLAWVAADLAGFYLDLRDADRARAMTEFVARLAPPEGSPPSTQVALAFVRGRLAAFEGLLVEARRQLESALELEERAGIRRRRAWILYHLARVHAQGGDLQAAERALALLEEMPVGPTHAEAALLRCELHLREALSHAGTDAGAIPGAPALGTAAPTSGGAGAKPTTGLPDLAPARRAVLRAMDICERFRDPEGSWRTRFWLGRLAALGGAHAEAERLYREAARAAQEVCALVPEELRAFYLADDLRLQLSEALTELERIRERERQRLALVAQAGRGEGDDDEVEADGDEAEDTTSGAAVPAVPEVLDEQSLVWRQKYARIYGRSPRLKQVFALLDKVAPHDSLVLIRGESGTGKELIAEAIHRHSTRADRPLVKVNCGALVESLLLSELFGHERGAFTGALTRRKGRFEMADSGTIFLDEIGDISPKTQVALLRVLQEREFERVGGTTPIHVDVRIICATNRDLEAMVRDGSFREDLYYRLKGLQIDLPALRERPEDVPVLCQHFLDRIAQERGAAPKHFDQSSQSLLCGYHWPGNVRELENLVRSVSLFAEGLVIGVKELGDYPELLTRRAAERPERMTQNGTQTQPSDAFARVVREGLSLRELKRQVEVECITQALREAEGNITRAAEILKMKRPRLSQLIKEYGIAI